MTLDMWLRIAFFVYAVAALVFILLQNRSPQATFAWFFFTLVFPVGGAVMYVLFGRGYRAFSNEQQLVRQIIGASLETTLKPIVEREREAVAALQSDGPLVYRQVLSLLQRIARAPLSMHNELTILQNAQEFYPRLIEDIRNARYSIHMLYYEWAADPFTEELKELLIAKAQQGVKVRIIYDPIGSFWMLKRSYVKAMNAGGVQMVPFSPLYRLHTISYRNHRKISVIDGQIGYSGGMNITQEHLTGQGGSGGWRDTQVRIAGEAVRGLQVAFLTMWYNATYEELSEDSYFPTPHDRPDCVPVQVVTSGPDAQWNAIQQLYFFMIKAAVHHVYIQTAFFILDESVANALRAAALSGVDVKIMLTPRGAEAQLPYRAGRTYAQEVARAGAQVYYYEGAYFHCKTIMVDSLICSIGSANMDIRSFSINYETNVVIYDTEKTRELEEDFLRDLQHCTRFSATEYDQSSFFERLGDSASRLFSPLL